MANIGQGQITIFDVYDGQNGQQGQQGIQGVRGEDGTTYYTWVKWADSPTTGMSDTPTNKAYMGIAQNKTSPTESTNYGDYQWVKVKGETGDRGEQGLRGLQGDKGDQGIQGVAGTDGNSSYTHIAYATNETGTAGFSVSDSANKTYIGIYVDTNATDSTDPTKYKWTLIKGQKGDQGIAGTAGADGKTPYFHTAYATNATGTSGFSTTDATGKTYIGTYTDFNVNDSTNPSVYTWALIKGDKGDKGDQGVQGVAGAKGADGKTTYTWVKYADDELGNGMSQYPEGKRYLGLAYNKTTATESDNKADYSWSPLYDNVVVGARNLIYNSSGLIQDTDGNMDGWQGNVPVEDYDGKTALRMDNSATSEITLGTKRFAVQPNTQYTIRVLVEYPTNCKGVDLYFLGRPTGSTNTAGFDNIHQPITADKGFTGKTVGKFKEYVGTFTTKANDNEGYIRLDNNGSNDGAVATVRFAELKMEEGNIATGYTQAPEDIEATIGDLGSQVTDIDGRTTPSAIIDTVVYDEAFTSIMNGKANVEDISDFANGEQLEAKLGEAIEYVDGRLDGEGGVIAGINEVKSSLEKSANEINAKFGTSGGINLIKNSIGFAELDFWKQNTGIVRTVQNPDLEQLGFGSGFYTPDALSGTLDQVVNIQPYKSDGTLQKHSFSMWLKKTQDNASTGYAGVDILDATGTKLAFIGKGSGAGVTNGWELGVFTFETPYNQVTIRITTGHNAIATITGLMLNVGDVPLQWQHANGEMYNTNIKFNLNGIKVINQETNSQTVISPTEFSGYAEVVNEDTGERSLERIFTLNGDTTEVTKLDVDQEMKMQSIAMRQITTASNKGWGWIAQE
jgi:hypothetical protein